MKKLIIFVLSLIILIVLSSCGKEEGSITNDTTAPNLVVSDITTCQGNEIDLTKLFTVSDDTTATDDIKITYTFMYGKNDNLLNGNILSINSNSDICILIMAKDKSDNGAAKSINVHVIGNNSKRLINKLGTKPIIDGKYDDVWDMAKEIEINHDKSNTDQATGTVRILYDDDGLYFYIEVSDGDVVEDADCVNLWINENTSKSDWSERSYLTELTDIVPVGSVVSKYPQDITLGAYSICIHPNGNISYYAGADVRDVQGLQKSVAVDELGYQIEIFMPRMYLEKYEMGKLLGFEISIDDFKNGQSSRYGYCNWIGTGDYWTDPTTLVVMCLK